MRLWSVHPKYLDRIGLVALWREGLLAQAVLAGRTVGYKHHPQLDRFKCCEEPVVSIAAYLSAVADEAEVRGYRFDRSKLMLMGEASIIEVTTGQMAHEWDHLLAKLQKRSKTEYQTHRNISDPLPHPSFIAIPGPVEPWERVTDKL